LIIFSNLTRSTVNRMSASHLRSMWSQSLWSGKCLRVAGVFYASSSMSSTVRPSIWGTAATSTLSRLMY
jgi:hypothetical protein